MKFRIIITEVQQVFLTAEWRYLIMANYEVDPEIARSFVPHGTELDLWNGRCYVSLVGFVFQNTRVRGLRIPFHSNFEEVNLRIYVQRQVNGSLRRGVTFIRELVPRAAIATIANKLYFENYLAVPMKHQIKHKPNLEVHYHWKVNGRESLLMFQAKGPAEVIKEGSEEEFITEHFWGYTKVNETLTLEYRVEHPRWMVFQPLKYEIACDFESIYGKEWAFLTQAIPASVFMADGSPVLVRRSEKI